MRYCRTGFPHSDISGSKLICSSPKLFAAYHVLHRLLMPRHSPCALLCLTYRRGLPRLSNNKRDGPILVLFRFELCRLICFTNKIVITHFVEACFVSFAAEQAHRLIHSAASPLDFEPAFAGLQNRKVKNVSLLLPSHNLHQMSQCSVFKVHRVSASFIAFAAEQTHRLNHFAALPFAP